jgi:hypothetical protein
MLGFKYISNVDGLPVQARVVRDRHALQLCDGQVKVAINAVESQVLGRPTAGMVLRMFACFQTQSWIGKDK